MSEVLTRHDGEGGRMNPGTWSVEVPTGGGKPNVVIACPDCGRLGALHDHEVTIHPDGTFTARPSIRCPRDCGFHCFVTRSAIRRC